MPTVHEYIGFFIVGAFAALWIWGLGAWIVKRDPGKSFWRLVAVVQVVVGVQVIAGVILLLLGFRRPWLHYAYGLFPILLFVLAHIYARRGQWKPWVPFAWAAFFCFGLTLRALMTGLGIG